MYYKTPVSLPRPCRNRERDIGEKKGDGEEGEAELTQLGWCWREAASGTFGVSSLNIFAWPLISFMKRKLKIGINETAPV